MIKIRKIKEKDIEKVVDIQIRGWQTAYKGIIDDEYLQNMSKEENVQERIERRRKTFNDSGFIVSETENEVTGFCRYSDKEYSNEVENVDCEIFALYIEPNLKRNGIGKELVKYVIKEFKNKGNKKMILWCLKENKPSRKFYEKIGGKYIKDRSIEIGGKNYEEVSYVYDIDEVYKKLIRARKNMK